MICAGCRDAANCATGPCPPCPARVVEMHLMGCNGCDCQHRLPSTYGGCDPNDPICETDCFVDKLPHAIAVEKYLKHMEYYSDH